MSREMARFFERLRQRRCVHWFDIGPDYEHAYSGGVIVCNEQRVFRVTMQRRVCSKCGLSEERRVSDPVCVGWE
jgi:hypothetical protein